MAWWGKSGQAEENPRCKTCGLRVWPPKPFGSASPSGSGGQGKLLTALVVLGLVNALGVGALFLRPTAPAPPMLVPTLIPMSAAPAPRVPSLPPAPSVALQASTGRKTVAVGSRVVLTAKSQKGRTETLVLSYQTPNGKRARLSLADGSLCSAVWTPTEPGHYLFSATATNASQQTVYSPMLPITVRGSGEPPRRLAARRPTVLARRRVHLAKRVPAHRRVRVLIAAWKGERRLPAAQEAPAVSAASPPLDVSKPIYHVVAGTFPRRSNADVFAEALRQRGYAASAYVASDKKGRAKYVVETGAYAHKQAAEREVLTLQKTGYPAHAFVKNGDKKTDTDAAPKDGSAAPVPGL